MAKLKDDIKRMLAALAYQDADENLSSYDKMKVLGYGTEGNARRGAEKRKNEISMARPRIALVIDRQGSSSAVNYAIGACQRQSAQIDLLLHGAIDSKVIELIERKITDSNISFKRIQLGARAVDDLLEYTFIQSTLIYLVSMSDDAVVRELLEEVLPSRSQSLSVPVVFMSPETPANRKKRTAA